MVECIIVWPSTVAAAMLSVTIIFSWIDIMLNLVIMVYMHITMTLKHRWIMRSTWERHDNINSTCVKCNKLLIQLWTNSLRVEAPPPIKPRWSNVAESRLNGWKLHPTKSSPVSLQYASSWQSGLLTSTPMRQVQWEHTRATSVNSIHAMWYN